MIVACVAANFVVLVTRISQGARSLAVVDSRLKKKRLKEINQKGEKLRDNEKENEKTRIMPSAVVFPPTHQRANTDQKGSHRTIRYMVAAVSSDGSGNTPGEYHFPNAVPSSTWKMTDSSSVCGCLMGHGDNRGNKKYFSRIPTRERAPRERREKEEEVDHTCRS